MRRDSLPRRLPVAVYRLGGRLVAALAVLVAVLMVVPAFFTIPVSFSATRYIIFPPKTWSLRWYEAYFTIPEWTGATGYSLLLAGLTMLVTLALGLPAAFGLARGTFRGKKAMILLFVVPLMIPVILIAMAEYFFLNDLGTDRHHDGAGDRAHRLRHTLRDHHRVRKPSRASIAPTSWRR